MITRPAVSLAAALASAVLPTASFAATTVAVELNNKSPMPDMPGDLGYGTAGADLTKSPMQIKLSRTSAPSGTVIFRVKNASKETVHEIVVFPIKDVGKPLPYNSSDNAVDEKALKSRGEVSELDPGKSGTLSVTLAPGRYLLVCNVAGHFAAGMWAEFTVTK